MELIALGTLLPFSDEIWFLHSFFQIFLRTLNSCATNVIEKFNSILFESAAHKEK